MSSSNWKHIFTAWNLRRFEHCPVYLQGNPYVRSGYRAYLSKAECMASVFKWTNETINIWSHLLGFFLFTGFLIHDTVVVIPTLDLTPGEIFTMLYFVLSIMLTLGSSVVYHTFNCHSQRSFEKFLKWDTSGIVMSVSGVYAFGFHTGLACHEQWRAFYESITIAFTILVFALYLKSKEKSSADHNKMTVILTTWIASGVLPTLHFAYLEGGFNKPSVQEMLLQVAVYYGFMGGAFFFYVTRYPEKCCPGKVDYLGASHQIWHCLTLAGFTWWHQTCLWFLERKFVQGCPQNELELEPL